MFPIRMSVLSNSDYHSRNKISPNRTEGSLVACCCSDISPSLHVFLGQMSLNASNKDSLNVFEVDYVSIYVTD